MSSQTQTSATQNGPDDITPMPPARKKKLKPQTTFDVETVIETSPTVEPATTTETAVPLENTQPLPPPAVTKGAIPKKKRSLFEKIKAIDINININVNDKNDKKEEAIKETSKTTAPNDLAAQAEEAFVELRKNNAAYLEKIENIAAKMKKTESTTHHIETSTEPEPEQQSPPAEPTYKLEKKKSLFSRFVTVNEEEKNGKGEEKEKVEVKTKKQAPEKEKRKSFFSKKDPEKTKDKIMYARVQETDSANAGTQTGEKDADVKKSFGEKVIAVQEKVHMVATGMAFTGAVLNKVGEEVNDKFAKKKDGNPKARTTTTANTLEMIGSTLKKTGDFEDKFNTQFVKLKKKPDEDEKKK